MNLFGLATISALFDYVHCSCRALLFKNSKCVGFMWPVAVLCNHAAKQDGLVDRKRTKIAGKQVCIALLCSFALVASAWSQTSDTGFPPFGTFQNGTFDSVNLQNLNVVFGIPAVSHPGRGLDFQFVLAYNSRVFHLKSGSSPAWIFGDGWATDGPSGSISSQRTGWPCFQMPSLTGTTNFVFIDPSGTSHPFTVQKFPSNPCGANTVLTGYATDGSGYFIDISGPTIVRAPDGTRYNMTKTNNFDSNSNLVSTTNPTITDPNGNSISSTTYYENSGTPNFTVGETDWTDTLGQIVLRIASISNGPSGMISEIDYNRLAVDGTYQPVAVKYEFVTLQTNFGCSGVSEYSGLNVRLVSEIDLPNGQKYSFTYEPTPGNAGAVTGRIQAIALPTGGSITYEYTGANGGLNCADGSVLAFTRTVNDGTNAAAWSYSRAPNGASAGTTTVTAPQLPYDTAANQTVVTFDSKGREISRKTYQGAASGNPLLTLTTSWASNNSPATKTAILEDGSTQSQVETTYDSNGNLQTMKEHDFGQGAPGPVLRTTSFQYFSSTAYTALNIINKVMSKTVADGSGTIKSRMTVGYDESPYINSNCIAGALQHDDTNFGCSYTTRGLATSITSYSDAATPGGAVAKHFSYDSVGNLTVADLNCCNQKHWNFSSATQYAFPDSVVSGNSSGAQLTTSATYYFATGQIKTMTDENGQVTTYTYADPGHMDRVTDFRRPDGVHFTNAYDDLHSAMTVTQPIQGLDALQKVTSYDGLGRPLTSAVKDANGNVSSIVKTQYDPVGRPYMASNPYTTSPQYWTTRQFDALNRLTATILPDGALTTSSYAISSAIITDPSGKQRKSMTNALGQVVEVDEPGGPDPGVPATASVTISGAFNSTWVGAGTPHLAATGTAIASVTLSDGSSHDFYFDSNQHLCQMSWFSGSGWFDQDLTSMTESALPLAGSSMAAVALGSVIHVFYQGANQHIYDMNWTGSIWQNLDMTVLTGASPVSNTKMAIVNTGSPNTPMMFYEGTNQHLFCVYWNSTANAWQNADLHSLSGATNLIAPNGAISAAMWGTTGNIHALFLDTNQNLNRIVWSGTAWITNNLTSMTGAALAVPGSKLTTIATGTPIDLMTFYEGAGQHIYSIYWNGSAGAYQTLDFTVFSGATNIAAVLTSLANNPVGPHMFYFSSNQHLDDMLWNGSAWVNADLTSLANTTAVPASGSSLSSHGTSGGNTYNIFFEGGNQHIYHTYYNPGAPGWFNEDPLVAASNFVVDSGTVSLTIPNGGSNFTATVCYGVSTNPICAGQPVNASPGAIANALAAVLNGAGSPVNASVSGATLSLTWRTMGVITTTVAPMTSTPDNPTVFPNGSFTATSGTFSGGIAASSQSLRNPFITTYTYGVFDNLLKVTQGAQTRTYTFDGMARLTNAATPEAGQISYQYNTSNLVTQRTDARGVITNYGYDTLNRLQTVTYNVGTTGVAATPALTYQYGADPTQNNNGRLIKMLDGLGSEAYTYDLLGRITQLQKVINGTTYNIGYSYNLASEVSGITYPSGTVVQQSFDALGRLCEIAAQTSGCGSSLAPYATGYSYNASSEMTGFNYGNGVTASFGYSPDRLQTLSLSYKKGTQTLFGLNYFYQQNSTSCPAGTSSNNGQIQCITDTVDNGRSVSYTYDGLGRLATAITFGSQAYPQSNLAFTYDRYGNRTAQSGSTEPVNAGTNQVATLPYDASGNMLSDGSNQLAYNAENRVVTSTNSGVGTSYSYDCKGFRTVKASAGTTTVYIFSGNKVIAEYMNGAAANAPSREYVYSGSRMLAKIEAGTTNYYHADHLSTRVTTDTTGSPTGQQGELPFGDQWYDVGNTPTRKFTEYQRDLESQNDYAVARHYVNRLGRFTSADPANGSILSPQSLNRYSYGLNDPINNSDPTGAFVLGYDLFLDPAGFPNWSDFGIFTQQFCTSVDDGPDVCDYSTILIEPAMAPGGPDPITLAKNKILGILNGNSPCANFFNQGVVNFLGGISPSQTPAADVLSSANIIKGSTGPSRVTQSTDQQGNITYKQPYGATTGQSAGYGATIEINPNGAFYNTSAFIQGTTPIKSMPLTIGGTDNPQQYAGDSLAAQMTIIMHELAHNIDLIPPDQGKGVKQGQSTANTQTVLDNCKDAIDAATKQK